MSSRSGTGPEGDAVGTLGMDLMGSLSGTRPAGGVEGTWGET